MNQVGRVYKIVHNKLDITYVGMTMDPLSKRWKTHKANKSKKNISIYKYFKEHGIDSFSIVMIKEYPVIDRNHLRVYETLWINKLKCINKYISFNPLPIKIYKKLCYLNNREILIERQKEYYLNNKERIREQQKLYRAKLKEQKKLLQ